MIRDGDFTTSPPAIISDENLFDGMAEIPAIMNPEGHTENPFYATLATTIQHRLEAIDHSQNIHEILSPDEIVEQCRALETVREDARRIYTTSSTTAELMV